MAETVRELITKWGFQVDDKPLEKMKESIDGVKEAVSLIGTQLLAAGGYLFGLTKSFADAGDAVTDTAYRLGVSTQALQELGYAAQLAGSNQEELNLSLLKFGKNVGDAAKGSGEAYDSLNRLSGLIGKDIVKSGGNTEQMLMDVVSAFGKMTDRTEKAKIAMDLFGMKGTSMLQFLDKGADGIAALRQEANALGYVMDEGALSAAGNFNDSIDKLKATLLGLRNIVGAQLAPVITNLIESFREWVLANREIIKENLISFSQTMLNIFMKTINVIKYIGTAVNSIVQKFGGWERVLTGISTLLLVIASGKLLSSLGTMAITVGKTLVTAFTAFGNAALMAQMKAAAIPLAIGAAIVATALIIDDFIAWMQGRPSIMGEWFGDYKNFSIGEIAEGAWISFKETVLGMGKWLHDALYDFLKPFNDFFVDLFKKMIDPFERVVNYIIDDIIKPKVKWLEEFLSKFFGKDIQAEMKVRMDQISDPVGVKKETERVKGFIGKIQPFFDSINNAGKSMVDAITPERSSPVGSIPVTSTVNNSAAQNSQVVNATVNVPVNVPAGSDPRQTQKLVKDGVDEALGELLRKTQSQTSTAIER